MQSFQTSSTGTSVGSVDCGGMISGVFAEPQQGQEPEQVFLWRSKKGVSRKMETPEVEEAGDSLLLVPSVNLLP